MLGRLIRWNYGPAVGRVDDEEVGGVGPEDVCRVEGKLSEDGLAEGDFAIGEKDAVVFGEDTQGATQHGAAAGVGVFEFVEAEDDGDGVGRAGGAEGGDGEASAG